MASLMTGSGGETVEDGRRVRDPDCLFCRIVAGEIPSDRVLEDEQVVAFRDISPRAPTHILLVPREHIPSSRSLTEGDGPLLAHLFVTADGIAAREGIAGAGYRLVVNTGSWGGQTVRHLHLHLLGGRAMSWPPG
jgi:histidine triad (HIT) family protein